MVVCNVRARVGKPLRRLRLLTVCGILLSGCETLGYYLQSGVGHMTLLSQRQSIEQLMGAPATRPELVSRLAYVQSVLTFAHNRLDLPDQGSYRHFVDVGREALVWSVVAAPEFSLVPKQWCYPIIGCANYRGYFKRMAAERYAQRLTKLGWDVAVQRVPAYSTLGWFNDPLPSTVIYWPKTDLAELIFHELAHQRLYISDDSAFNESYASVVAAAGVRQWAHATADDQELKLWRIRQRSRKVIDRLILSARDELEGLYRSDTNASVRKRKKNAIFDQLKSRYDKLASHPGYQTYRGWFEQTLNNAHLVSISTYQKWVPALQQLLRDTKCDFRHFHRRVAALGMLPAAQRTERLTQLAAAATSTDHDAIVPVKIVE